MPDYELMELVLFAAIPRRDVKPLAKHLIDHFGSFADAIAAPRERLLEIDGVGEARGHAAQSRRGRRPAGSPGRGFWASPRSVPGTR